MSQKECWRIVTVSIVAAASLATTGCGGDDNAPINGDPQSATFHFKMIGDTEGLEDFRAVTSDQAVIAIARDQLSKPEGERIRHIVGGVDYGNGGFNLHWNWHFIPDSWTLAEVSIELCDTGPILISQCVQCWVEARGGACPWGSYVAYEVLDDWAASVDAAQQPVAADGDE